MKRCNPLNSKNRKNNQSGQAVVEYLLILSISIVLSGLLFKGLNSSLDSGIRRFGMQLEKDLKTGRIPSSIWIN